MTSRDKKAIERVATTIRLALYNTMKRIAAGASIDEAAELLDEELYAAVCEALEAIQPEDNYDDGK